MLLLYLGKYSQLGGTGLVEGFRGEGRDNVTPGSKIVSLKTPRISLVSSTDCPVSTRGLGSEESLLYPY